MLISVLLSFLNYQSMLGTHRVISAHNQPEPSLTFTMLFNGNWRRYSYDSVSYLSDTGFESVSRWATQTQFGFGYSGKYYETSLSAPFILDFWAGKFDNDINAFYSMGMGDIFWNNKFSYDFTLAEYPASAALIARYSFPIAPGQWDTSQTPDTSSLGVPFSGGVWRLLGYGSNSSFFGTALAYDPLEIFCFNLNMGFNSGANGDPTDNTFDWGTSLEIRMGSFIPFAEYYTMAWSNAQGDSLHGNAPAWWTLGFQVAPSAGAGFTLGLDFWQRTRDNSLDNRDKPDFWLMSWTPDLSFWIGVNYLYQIKHKAPAKATGVVWGTVFDKNENKPIKALVSIPEAGVNRQPTDSSGVFRIENVPAGKATLVVEAPGMELFTETISVPKDNAAYKNVFLSSKTQATGSEKREGIIAGKVIDKFTGEPLAARISFIDLNIPDITTDPNTGLFKVPDAEEGLYTLSVQADGYKPSVEVVGVKPGEPVVKDIALVPEGKTGQVSSQGDDKSRATAAAFVSMAQEKASKGEYEDALRYLDIAGVWDPDNPQIKRLYEQFASQAGMSTVKGHLEKGISLYNEGKYLDALAEFDQALQSDPSSESAKKWFDLAFNALLSEQSTTKQQVSKLLADGVALYAKGKIDSAVVVWQQVLGIDPDNQDAKTYIANAQNRKMGQVQSLVEQGKSLMSTGRYSSAIAKFNKALAIEPDNQAALQAKADAQAKLRQIAQNRLNEGKKLFNAGKLDDAEAKLRSALRLDPSLSQAKTYLAKITEARKKQKSVSKPTGDVEALYLKGVEAYVKEDYQTAIYYWNKVLQIDPNHHKAKKNIAKAKQKLGQ